jgi:hypothetical protein
MSASVSFNCEFCAVFKKCKIKPKDNHKQLKGKDRMCFESQKSLDNMQTYIYRGKRVNRKKLEEQKEESENANG